MVSNIQELARELIFHQPPSILRSAKTRAKFSRDLCETLGYWSFDEISNFVDEMRGLNFSSVNDRETFLSMLFVWIPLEGDQ